MRQSVNLARVRDLMSCGSVVSKHFQSVVLLVGDRRQREIGIGLIFCSRTARRRMRSSSIQSLQ